jgi:RNA polymerase sigma-70 factor (ECF subfamily)
VGIEDLNQSERAPSAQVFATTHWSVVLRARDTDDPGATDALENLCRIYWYPLYAYLRKRGYSEHDAQDLTQGFFAHLLQRDTLRYVAPEKDRFRSFLLACLQYYVPHERERAQAQKRGGGVEVFSLDSADAEQRVGCGLCGSG